ncbi:hypothetical protein [Dyella psychrodurans]|uniref:hypothetical protein n=1 Tax=Dyella psychrodurans TaxID=1927960 RepID=UPI00131436BF|nr:hypothetical protein [Dyella psychrodurans]
MSTDTLSTPPADPLDEGGIDELHAALVAACTIEDQHPLLYGNQPEIGAEIVEW